MHDIHLPPPRSGDHNAVNRHLTAGGTVEGARQENPYREYYLSLIKKNMDKPTWENEWSKLSRDVFLQVSRPSSGADFEWAGAEIKSFIRTLLTRECTHLKDRIRKNMENIEKVTVGNDPDWHILEDREVIKMARSSYDDFMQSLLENPAK